MKSVSHTGQSMQRVKVGMIGLAVVILLMALAGAMMRSADRQRPVTTVGAPKEDVVANMVTNNEVDVAGEPLAEMGVAPSDENVQETLNTE